MIQGSAFWLIHSVIFCGRTLDIISCLGGQNHHPLIEQHIENMGGFWIGVIMLPQKKHDLKKSQEPILFSKNIEVSSSSTWVKWSFYLWNMVISPLKHGDFMAYLPLFPRASIFLPPAFSTSRREAAFVRPRISSGTWQCFQDAVDVRGVIYPF